MRTSTLRNFVHRFFFLFCFLSFSLLGSTAFGQSTWTNGGLSGIWNDPNNWAPVGVPAGVDVIFDGTSTDACAIDVPVNVTSISINAGYTGTITQNAGQTVTIGAGGFTQADGASIFTGGDSDITVGGNFTLTAGTFTATTANLSVTEDFANTGTFNANTGTVTFVDGAGNANISGVTTFENIVINKAPGTENLNSTLAGTQITAVTTQLNGGRLRLTNINGASDLGTFTGASGTRLEINGGNLGVGWDGLGDFSGYMSTAGTTIQYIGATDYDIPVQVDGQEYRNLVIEDASIKSFPAAAGDVVVNEDLSILADAVLDINDNGLNFLAGSNVTFGNDDSTIRISGATNFSTATIAFYDALDDKGPFNATEGTFIFDGTVAQDISAFTFNRLQVESTGAKNISGDVVVNGDFSQNNPVGFNLGTNQLTYNGGVAITASAAFDFDDAGSTVIYNSGGAQDVINTTYDNLTLSNAGNKTTLGDIAVNATTTTSGAAVLDLGSNDNGLSTLDLDIQLGSAVNSGDNLITATTVDIVGTLDMTTGTTGSGTLSALNINVGNGTDGGLFTGFNGNVVVGNILTVNADGDFDGGAGTMATLDLNNVTVNGAGEFQAGPNNTTVSGAFTMATPGNFDANSGTFTYDGAGAQQIQPLLYNNLSTSGSAKTTTAGGIIDVDGTYNGNADLTLQNTIQFGGGVSLVGNHDFEGSGTATVIYDQTLAGQIVISETYNNLTVSNGAKTTAGGASTIDVNGAFDGAANFTLNGATIQFGGTITYSGTGDFSSGTTVYDANAAQNVIPTTYENLTLATADVKSLTGNTTVTGALTNSTGGVTFDIAANQLDIQGTFTTGGTYDFDAGTVAYSGIADQNIINTLYNDIILTDGDANGNIKTATAALDINGNITISNATVFDADNFTHTVAGNWTEVGTGSMDITANPTITFDSGVTHNITGGADFNVIGNAALTDILAFGAGETFNIGSFNLAVGDCNNSSTITSTAPPTRADIFLSAPQTLNFVDIQNINSTNAGGFITINSNFGNNNTGFITPDATAGSRLFYWTGAGADNNWTTTDNWSLISSIGAAAGCYPDATDESVIFDAGIVAATPVIVDLGGIDIENLTWGGTAGIDLQLTNALSVYGNIVEGAANAFTISGANNLVLTGGTNTTIDLDGTPTVNANIEINKTVGNTVTQSDALLIASNLIITQGEYLTGNFAATMASLTAGASDATREFDMTGTNTLTITGTGTVFDISGNTVGAANDAVFTADATSTINFTNTGAVTLELGQTARTIPNTNFTTSTGIVTVNADGSGTTQTFSSITDAAAGGTFDVNFPNNRIAVTGNVDIPDNTTITIDLQNGAANTFSGLFDVGNTANFTLNGGNNINFDGNVTFGTGGNITFNSNQIGANAGFSVDGGTTINFNNDNHAFVTFTINPTDGTASTVNFNNTSGADIAFAGDFTVGTGDATVNVANEITFNNIVASAAAGTILFDLNTGGNASTINGDITTAGADINLNINTTTAFNGAQFTINDIGIATGATLTFNNSATGPRVINDITMVAGSTLQLPENLTTTVNDFIIPGPCVTTALTIESNGANGAPLAGLSVNNDEIFNGATIRDIDNTGATTIEASSNPSATTNNNIIDNLGANSTYYWTNGNGTNVWNDVANWSFSTGGAAAGCFPDDPTHNVVFDNNSPAGNLTMANVRNVGNVDWNGSTAVNLILNNNLEVNGSLNTTAAATALTVDAASTGTMLFEGANTATINTLGVTLPSLQLAKTNTTTLEGDLTVTGTLTHTDNSLITDGFNITTGTYSSTGANARTLDLQSGTGGDPVLTINNGGTSFDVSGAAETAITLDGALAGEAIVFTNAGAITMNIGAVAKTFPDVSFTTSTGAVVINADGGGTVMTFESITKGTAGGSFTINEVANILDVNGVYSIASTIANPTTVTTILQDNGDVDFFGAVTIGNGATSTWDSNQLQFHAPLTFGEGSLVNFDGENHDFFAGATFTVNSSAANPSTVNFNNTNGNDHLFADGFIVLGDGATISFDSQVTLEDFTATGANTTVSFNTTGNTSTITGVYTQSGVGSVMNINTTTTFSGTAGVFTIRDINIVGTGTLRFNNNNGGSANDITMAAGATIRLPDGQTTTVNDFIIPNSCTPVAPTITIRSDVGGTDALLALATSEIWNGVTVQDINNVNSPATTIDASNNPQAGTNVNITDNVGSNSTFYWTNGNATNIWNDGANWSFSTGGVAAGCIPNNVTHSVVFDGSSPAGNVQVDITPDVNDIFWDSAPAGLNIFLDNNNIEVNGDLNPIGAASGAFSFSTTSGNEALIFEGANAATIDPLNVVTIPNIIINKDAGATTVTLNNNLTVNGELTLNRGTLTGNGNNLTVVDFNSRSDEIRSLDLSTGTTIMDITGTGNVFDITDAGGVAGTVETTILYNAGFTQINFTDNTNGNIDVELGTIAQAFPDIDFTQNSTGTININAGGGNTQMLFESISKSTAGAGTLNVNFPTNQLAFTTGNGAVEGMNIADNTTVNIDVQNSGANDYDGDMVFGAGVVLITDGNNSEFRGAISFGDGASWTINAGNYQFITGGSIGFANNGTWNVNGNGHDFYSPITFLEDGNFIVNGNNQEFRAGGDITMGNGTVPIALGPPVTSSASFIINGTEPDFNAGVGPTITLGDNFNFQINNAANDGNTDFDNTIIIGDDSYIGFQRDIVINGTFTTGANATMVVNTNTAGIVDFNNDVTFGNGSVLDIFSADVLFDGNNSFVVYDMILRTNATNPVIVDYDDTPTVASVNEITLEENTQLRFSSNGTTNVANIITPGPCPAPAVNAIIRSDNGGNQADVNFTGAQQDWYYVDVRDINASGTVPINVLGGGTDNGNNTNINFYPNTPLAGRTLYWVGGAGNWDDCDEWSLSSGGAPGIFPPTAYDNVIFDNNSFTAAGETVTITADAVVKNFTWQDNALDGARLNLANELWIYDDFNLAETNLGAGLPIDGAATLSLSSLTSDGATSTSTITLNGATLPGNIHFGNQNATVDAGANDNDSGGNAATWTFADAMTVTGDITLTEGTVNTNTQNVTAASITSNGTLTRSLNMTNSAVTLTGIGTVIDFREAVYAAVEAAAGTEPTIVSAGTETINFTGVGAITLQLGLDTKTIPNLNFVSGTNVIINTGGLTVPASETVTIGNITKANAGGQLYINEENTSTDKTTIQIGAVTVQDNTDFHIEMNDSGANTIASITSGNNTAFQYIGDQSNITGNVTFGDNTILDWRDAAIVQGDFTVGNDATQGFPIGDLTASDMQFQGNVTFGDNPVITFEDGVQFLGGGNTINFAGAPATGGGTLVFNSVGGTTTVEGDLLFGNGTTSDFNGDGTFSGNVTYGGNATFAGGTTHTFNAAAGAVTSSAGVVVNFNGNAAASFTNTGNNNFGGNFRIGSGATTISFANVGNNDFTNIAIGNNRTLAFTPNGNGINTVTGTISTLFICPTNPITITSSSGVARLDLTSVQSIFRATVSNIDASNGAKMNVYQGTDGGGNNNVFFEGDAGFLDQRIVYWVGGTNAWSANTADNWNDFDNAQVVPTNWAATSGGAGGECIPTIYDDVIFDGGSGIGAVNYDVIAGPNTYDAEARNFTIEVTTGALTFNGNGDLIVTGNFTSSATITWDGTTHQFDAATSNGSVTFAAVNGTEASTIDPGVIEFPHASFDGHAAVDVLAGTYPALTNLGTAPDASLYSFTLTGDLTVDSEPGAANNNAGILFFVNGSFDAAGFNINTGNFDTNETVTSGEPRTLNFSTGNFNVSGRDGIITNETVGPKLHTLFTDGANSDNDGTIIGDLRGGALTLDADETTFNFQVAQVNTIVLGDQDFATYGTAYEQTLGDMNVLGNDIDLTLVNSNQDANHSIGNITLSGDDTDLFVRDIDGTIDPIITIGSVTTNGAAGNHVVDLDASVVFGDGTSSTPATPAQLDPTATAYSGNLDFQTQTELRFDGNGVNTPGNYGEYVVNGTIDLVANSTVQVTDNNSSLIVHGNVGAATAGNTVIYTLDGLTHTFNGTFTTGATNTIIAPTNGSTTTYNGDVTLGATNVSIYNGDAVIFNENLTTAANNIFNITNGASNNIFGNNVPTDITDFGTAITGTLLGTNTFDSHTNIESSGGANVNDLQFFNSTFNGRFEFGYDNTRAVTATVPPAGFISFFGNVSTNFNDHIRFGEETQVDFNGTTNFNATNGDGEVGSVTTPQWPAMPDFTTEPDLSSSEYYPHNLGVAAQDDVFLQFGPLSVINFNGIVNLNRGDIYFIGSEVLPAISLPIAIATTINIDGVITSTEDAITTGQKITFGDDALVNFLDNSTGSSFSQIYANIGTDMYFNDNLNMIMDHLRLSRRNEVLLSRNGILQITGNPWDGDADPSNTLPAVKTDTYNGLSDGTSEPLNAGGFTARVRCDSWLTITNNEDTANPLGNEYATIRFADPHFHRWQNVEIAKLRVTSDNTTTGNPPGWSAAAGALLRIDGDIELDDVILDDSTTPSAGSPDPNATIWKPEPVAPQILYWIGQAGQPDPNLSDFDAALQVIVRNSNWTNPWNWVEAPGDQPGSQGCVPNGRDIVVFDAASFGGTTFDNTVNLTTTSPAFAGASTAVPANVFYNPYVDNGATAHIVLVDDDRIRIQDMEWIDGPGVGEALLAADGVDYVTNGPMDQTGTLQLAATGIAVDFVFQMRGSFIGGELMNNQYEGVTEFYSTDAFDPLDTEANKAAAAHYVHNKYNGVGVLENSFKGGVRFESNSTSSGAVPNLDPDTDRAWYLRSDLVIRDGTDITTRGNFEVRSGQVYSEQFDTGTPNDYYNITLEGDWLMQQRGVFNEGEGTVTVTGTLDSNIQTDEDDGVIATADFDQAGGDDFTTNRNPFYNLIIDKTNADDDVFLQNDPNDGLDNHGITVLNNLTVSNGVLRDNSYQIRGNNNGGDLTLSSTATLVIDIGQSDPSATLTLPNVQILQGESYIIAGNGATDPNLTSALDLTNIVASLNNGTDAIVLENAGAVVDIIGQVGLTTDVAWFNGAMTLSTVNSKIWRTVPNGTANIFPATYVLDDPGIGWVDQLGGGTVSATAGATVYGDVGTNAIAPAGGSPELIISEYIHDPVGNNDVIVIYNNTGAPVNLSTYTLTRYNNDDGQATEFPTYYLNTDVDLDIASNVVYNSGQVQRIRRLSDNADPTVYSGTNQNYGNLYIRNVGNKRLDTGMEVIHPGTAADADPTNNAVNPTDRNSRVRGDLVIADGASTTDITQLSDAGYQFVFNPTNEIRMGEFTRFTIGEQGAFAPTHFPTLYDRNNVFLTNRVAFNIGNVTQTVGAAHVESEVIYNAGGDNQTTVATDIEVSGATAAPQRATDADLLEAQFVAGEITYADLTFTNPYIVAGNVTGIPLKVINNGDPSAATGGLANPTIILGNLTVNESNHVFDNGNQIQGATGQNFVMGNNTFLSLGNQDISLFPTNYLDADIDFNINSTVIYNASDENTIESVAGPTNAQKVRRLSSATANQNYGNLIIRNGRDANRGVAASVPDNDPLAYKDLDEGINNGTVPTSGTNDVIVRGDLTVEEWAELRDAGYQILGDDQGSFTVDNNAVIRFGGTTSETNLTAIGVVTRPTQLPYSPYISGGFPTINLSETTSPATAKVVFTSDYIGTAWPTVSIPETQFVFADLDFPNLTITQWTADRTTEKAITYFGDDFARISLTSGIAVTEPLEIGLVYASASTAATPPGPGTATVTVTNQTNGDSETLILTEVGTSGYFVNTITTSGGAVTGGNSNIELAVGDAIRVEYTYTTVINALNLTASANTVVTNVTSVPTASISQNISAGTPINITLRDSDLDTNPGVAESLAIEIQNQTTGETEATTVTLVETGVSTGIFTGSLPTSAIVGTNGNNSGTMYIQDGDVIEVGTGALGSSTPVLPLTTSAAAAYTFTPPVGVAKDDLTITGDLVIAVEDDGLDQPYAGLPNEFRTKFIDDGNQIVGSDTRNFFMGDSTYLIIGRDEFATDFPQNFINTNIDFEDLSTVVYNAGDGVNASAQNIRLLSDVGRANGNYGNLVLRTFGANNVGTNLQTDGIRSTKTLLQDGANTGGSANPASDDFAGAGTSTDPDLTVRGFLEVQSNIDLFDGGYQMNAFDNTARYIQRQSTRFYIGDAAEGTTFPDFAYDEVFIDMPIDNTTVPATIPAIDITAGTPFAGTGAAILETEIIYQANANQTVRNLFDSNANGPNSDVEINAGGIDNAGALVVPNPGAGSYQQSYPKLTLTGTDTKTTEAGTTDLRIRGDFTINNVEFAIGAANTNVYLDDNWASQGDDGDFNITTASDVHFEGYHSQHISDTPATPNEDDQEVFSSITINNNVTPVYFPSFGLAVHLEDHVEVDVNAEFIEGHVVPEFLYRPSTAVEEPLNIFEDFSPFSYHPLNTDVGFNPGKLAGEEEGIIEKELRFDNDATVVFPTASIALADASHSLAPVRKTGTADFIFPVGVGTRFRPAGIRDIDGASTSIIVDYFRAKSSEYGFWQGQEHYEPRITNVSFVEFWMIDNDPMTPEPGENTKVLLTWDDADATGNYSGKVKDYPTLGVAKFNNADDNWYLMTPGLGDASPAATHEQHPVTGVGALSNDYGAVVSNGINVNAPLTNALSPFTLANTGIGISNNPLPVTLIDFNATAVGDAVKLVWQTASEFNTLNFEIQRSTDGINFETIGVVEAAGNSSTLLDYTTWDNNPPIGTVYYRLKINDADETFEYSKVRAVQFDATQESMFIVYPNPSAGIDLNFDFEIPESEMERLSIYDLTGKPIPFKTIMQNDRTVQVQFTQKLPTGIYVAVMQGKDGSVMKEKFTVK